ncbi:MAG: DUF3052 domain-containing protein [Actinomycetota bacterium]|nr:DUF3052 domain-containing protein [Actinomycetota bacterium]
MSPPAGYSGTPLPKKLGIKEGARLCVVREPEGFREALGALPDGVRVSTRLGRDADVIVAFFTRRSELERRLSKLLDALDVDGGLWIAWPKRASGVETDIGENSLRELGLPLGLVDNKVCAIDATWSGLRLVFRRENRDAVRSHRAKAQRE